jgi:anaerobic selenocysteine-containing dehydrogenase
MRVSRASPRQGAIRVFVPIFKGVGEGHTNYMSKANETHMDTEDALIKLGRFFSRQAVSPDLRSITKSGGRSGDVFYRDRWSHDKVVRSTHGVNCTGSCSWKVYVKDGIITWETQQTDYPSIGPDSPEYEPRGCPRGAAFSWYTYSPTRIRFPYIRGVLLDMYRESKARLGDPVLAWADVVNDPERRKRYHRARGKGGLVRANWTEISEIIAAAHVHTIKKSLASLQFLPCPWLLMRLERDSFRSWAEQCSPSTTGTPTFLLPRLKSSEIRPMFQNPPTGLMHRI